jgi:xylan 1,4-beta-xylosidase
MKNILDVAGQWHANIEGMLTWAFEFEDQPYFDGFRTLATNGIDKPVLNVFRLLGKMSGQRVGVNAGSNAIAARDVHQASVVTWNYGTQAVQLKMTGLPDGPVTVHRYQVDETHANAWTAWKQMGSPQKPSGAEYQALLKASTLPEFAAKATVQNGVLEMSAEVQGDGVTLFQVTW